MVTTFGDPVLVDVVLAELTPHPANPPAKMAVVATAINRVRFIKTDSPSVYLRF